MQLGNTLQAGSVVWIVAPHADDEALGCGGMIAVARRNGARVYALFLTVSGYAPLSAGQASSHDERRSELEAAMASAGVDGYDVMFDNGKHHCYLDTVPVKDMMDWLECDSRFSARAVQPDVMLLPSGRHSHQDHRQVFDAAGALIRVNLSNNGRSRTVLEYEIPGMGSPEVHVFEPNVFLSLSEDDVQRKCAMFEHYRSQIAPAPHPRSSHAIKVLAAHRGVEAGYDYAEAYRLIRAYVGSNH